MPRAVRTTFLLAFGVLLAAVAPLRSALAQAGGTATAGGLLSTFAAVNGTETGLSSGRNLGFTAGLDLGFQPFHGIYPSLEVRGTLPVDKGHVDSQKTLLGGIKLAVPLPRFNRVRPYGTVLFGRGSIDYGAGYQVPRTNIFYTVSHSDVFDLGGGIDLKLSDYLFLKLDAQAERFSTPVTASQHLYATSASVGLLYRFHFKRLANEVLH